MTKEESKKEDCGQCIAHARMRPKIPLNILILENSIFPSIQTRSDEDRSSSCKKGCMGVNR